MPEGYTHLRVAAGAAAAVRHKIKWPAAFAAGANGPDIFFCYQAWRKAKNRRPDLPALGARLHEENTGAFLMSLVRGARTGPQAEYVLGFLSHYAADAALHPYAAALCAPGMPYAQKGGHGYFEIALDSALHKQDTGRAPVPAAEACPTPVGEELADVTALLRGALREVYGLDIPAEAIADSFFHSTKLRGLFTSRFGVRRAFFWLIEPLFGGRGRITGHVSPRKLKKDLPDTWTDPYTGAPRTGDAFALLKEAQAVSEKYMAAAILFWTRRQPAQAVEALLGSVSYIEGRPTPQSDPQYAPPAEPASPQDAAPQAAAPEDALPQETAPEEEAVPETPPPQSAVPPETAPKLPAPPEPAPAPAAPALSAEEQQALLDEGLALIAAARGEAAGDTPPAEEPEADGPIGADEEPEPPEGAVPAEEPEEVDEPAEAANTPELPEPPEPPEPPETPETPGPAEQAQPPEAAPPRPGEKPNEGE